MTCKCGRVLEPGEWGSAVSFRLIEWGRDAGEDNVTLETSVGHLLPHERVAVLASINAFACALVHDIASERERGKGSGSQPTGEKSANNKEK